MVVLVLVDVDELLLLLVLVEEEVVVVVEVEELLLVLVVVVVLVVIEVLLLVDVVLVLVLVVDVLVLVVLVLVLVLVEVVEVLDDVLVVVAAEGRIATVDIAQDASAPIASQLIVTDPAGSFGPSVLPAPLPNVPVTFQRCVCPDPTVIEVSSVATTSRTHDPLVVVVRSTVAGPPTPRVPVSPSSGVD